jgi:hypothetical protein
MLRRMPSHRWRWESTNHFGIGRLEANSNLGDLAALDENVGLAVVANRGIEAQNCPAFEQRSLFGHVSSLFGARIARQTLA